MGGVAVMIEQGTHKSQPDELPLRAGAICAGGAVDKQRTTAASLPVGPRKRNGRLALLALAARALGRDDGRMTTLERNLCMKAVVEFAAWMSTRPGVTRVGTGEDVVPLIKLVDDWCRKVGMLKTVDGKAGFAGARGAGVRMGFGMLKTVDGKAGFAGARGAGGRVGG